MSIRVFCFRVLPVVAGLFLGALLLASCDSGADFSSLDDLSPDGDIIAKVRAWYEVQTQITNSDYLAKTFGNDDSLAVDLFRKKFSPDWRTAVLLSRNGRDRTLAVTLGRYTDERHDTTFYHVRTMIVDLNSSGSVESGNFVVFSSRDELSKDRFRTYAQRYLAKNFGQTEMAVSRYTLRFQAVDAFLYRSDQFPLPIATRFEKREVNSSGKLGKLGVNASIAGPDKTCYLWCHIQTTETCVGDYCGPGPNTDVFCTTLYCDEEIVGDGGGGGNDGGGGDSEEEEEEEEEECECASQHQCDLADEYPNGRYTCDDFINEYPGYSIYGRGNEYGKHANYTFINDQLPVLHRKINEFINGQGIYEYVTITSGYRCPKGNKDVYDHLGKPEKDSRHKYGRALDIKINDSRIWNRDLKLAIRQRNRDLYPNTDSYIDSWVHISVN